MDKARENGIGVWYFSECDYVAAESLEAAKAWYMSETGLEESDLDPVDETGDLDANSLVLLDEDDNPTEESMTFREAIQQTDKFPSIIATSEH